MKRNGNAVWDGRLKSGHGVLSTDSGCLHNIPYSFASRFESAVGANPEELLAAAHAACFSMSLANELEISSLPPTKIETKASVRIEFVEKHWDIQEIDLFLTANLRGSPALPFLLAASRAKSNCPLSNAFAAKITLHTELQEQHPGSEKENEVVIYTSTFCQVSGKAKELLESKGIRYREIDLDIESPEFAEKLKQKTGLMTVPQIFVGEHFIGSYKDLVQLDTDHGLKQLLQAKGNSPL
jgi:osmotically inducible protein OsmC